METTLIQGYKVFQGRYNEQMPLLVREGFQPLTTKDVMQYRLQAIQGGDKDEIKFWFNDPWDTVTGLAYHNDMLVIDPNSQLLLNINRNTKDYLPLTQEQFDRLAKEHGLLKRSKLIIGRCLNRKEAKDDELWYRLSGCDRKFQSDYVDAFFDVSEYDENMGICLPYDQENPALCGWVLWGLISRSEAVAGNGLYHGLARLLGVRAQNLEEVLEKSKDYTFEENFEYWKSLNRRMETLISQEKYEEVQKVKKIRDEVYKTFLG